MAVVQEKSNLPSTVDWLPHAQAAAFLGVHESQYRRDRALLNDLGIIQTDKYAKGCDRECLTLLQEFRQLVEERGRLPGAKELIRRKNHDDDN